MACYSPLHAYKKLLEKTEAGKSVIVFNINEAKNSPYEKIDIPCGQCIGCRIDKSRDWAVRCVHEASMHEENCFITLTFNDENLMIEDENNTVIQEESLNKQDFQKFMKRFRKYVYPQKIRYFHCGEYGSENQRPHHHACIFGYDFPMQSRKNPDGKYLYKEVNGIKLYRSQKLEELWPYGFCTIGEVTWESAAYVARYVMKKVNGEKKYERYVKDVNKITGECKYIEPEYITMSLKPGIGKTWYEKNKQDTNKDFLTVNGTKHKIPKYYDRLLEQVDVWSLEGKKYKRKIKALSKDKNENSTERLIVKRKVKERSINNLVRNL